MSYEAASSLFGDNADGADFFGGSTEPLHQENPPLASKEPHDPPFITESGTSDFDWGSQRELSELTIYPLR
jgi:hypothetical protein